jgi:hypothetical protein
MWIEPGRRSKIREVTMMFKVIRKAAPIAGPWAVLFSRSPAFETIQLMRMFVGKIT